MKKKTELNRLILKIDQNIKNECLKNKEGENCHD